MNILFVCNQNENRSKTAEALFKNIHNTRSAGLFNENSVTQDQIKWADTIVVMEDTQRSEIAKRFPKEYMQKQILSLDIPDIYRFNQPELIGLLKNKIKSQIL